MILGYDTARPQTRNYQDFEAKLETGLRELGIEGLSLMLYGSYVRGDYVAGRSDIDALLIFPDDVVIDKENLRRCGKVIKEAQKGNNIPFQVNVADISTMRDGRFNSYTPDFKDYFAHEARIVIGPDYRPKMKYEMPTHPEQLRLAFNLRKNRQGLLFAYQINDYEKILDKFGKALDAISRAPKQVLHMMDGTLRKSRFSGLDEMRERMPTIDVSILEQTRQFYSAKGLKDLDALYRDREAVLTFWEKGLTTFEEIVREYIRQYLK